jgi:prepilin-type N-terminal cleavage/methylation domain
MQHQKNRQTFGFSIVEIMIVIVVIGILTAMAITIQSSNQSRARDEQRLSNARIIAQKLDQHYEKNGGYPSHTVMTSTDVTDITSVLTGLDPEVLVMPMAEEGTVNSVIYADPSGFPADDEPVGSYLLYYSRAVSNCSNSKLDCSYYRIGYQRESDESLRWICRDNGRPASSADRVDTIFLNSGYAPVCNI